MGLLNFGKVIELRQMKGWDQQTFAAAANVDPSVISRLERGVQEDFRLSVVMAIASALGVTVSSLLIAPYPYNMEELAPELQAVIHQLSEQPERVQRQAAAIMAGYLASLKGHE